MTSAATQTQPLWLSIEAQIAELGSSDFEGNATEGTVHKLADTLDGEGFNVSRHAANMLTLRRAVDERARVGRPMITDYTSAIDALQLEDLVNPVQATITLAHRVGDDWPEFLDLDRRGDLRVIVDAKRLDLMIAKANEIGGDQGVRYLMENEIPEETIMERMGIDEAQLEKVKADLAAEIAEIARVEGLLKEVEGQSDDAKAKFLINKDVADESIISIAELGQDAIDLAKKAMVEEMAEKARLAAEAEAAKKAAAEGPKLEDIPADEMAEHIEAIREIMEFSDDADEIRTMCEQSNLPKELVEIAVTDAAKFDELEAAAEG
jgi:hypothetical protein